MRDSWAGSCLHHHLGLNVADERSGGNEHSADVTALGVVLLRGLQSNAEMRSAAGVAMRFTARLGYTADLSDGLQFAWFVRARNAYETSVDVDSQARKPKHGRVSGFFIHAFWLLTEYTSGQYITGNSVDTSLGAKLSFSRDHIAGCQPVDFRIDATP